MSEAAKQLAAVVPGRQRISLTVENRTTLDAGAAAEFRRAVEVELSAAGVELARDAQPLRLILSENVRGTIAIAQFGSKTIVVPWNPAPARAHSRARLTMSPLWVQSEPVLDILLEGDSLLVLGPAHVASYKKHGEVWQNERSAVLNFPAPLPRDPRGRLTGGMDAFRILTAAGSCTGTRNLALTCGPQGEGNAWVTGRNTQRDAALGEYYNLADLGEGRLAVSAPGAPVRITGANTAIAVPSAGTELAPLRSACGTSWLATGATSGDTDSLAGMNAAGAPTTDAVTLDGTVQALWPAGDDAVHAIVFHPATQSYETFRVTITCPE